MALCDRCISKLEGFKFYRNSYAFGFYEGVLQDLVCFAKYKGYGEPLKELVFAFKTDVERLKGRVDLIVPVPEDPSRRRIFNHLIYLGRLLGIVLGVELSSPLYKIKSTPPQVGLSKSERENNLKGAFAFRDSIRDKVIGKRVLLIDDVLTTGATLSECSKVLLEAGASEVQRLVIAASP